MANFYKVKTNPQEENEVVADIIAFHTVQDKAAKALKLLGVKRDLSLKDVTSKKGNKEFF